MPGKLLPVNVNQNAQMILWPIKQFNWMRSFVYLMPGTFFA